MEAPGGWVTVVLALINLVQTMGLALLAESNRRWRAQDRRRRPRRTN